MNAAPTHTLARELLSTDLGRFVGAIGCDVGRAQAAFMHNGLAQIAAMSGADPSSRVVFGGTQRSLLELGFRPVFHVIRETRVSVKVTYSMARGATHSDAVGLSGPHGSGRCRPRISPQSVTTSNRYQFGAAMMSCLQTRVTPVPPPGALIERIHPLRDVVEPSVEGEGG